MKLTIEKIVHGGFGLGHYEHGALLVPMTAAGEEVEVERKGQWGQLVRVITPSPARVEPPCPLYGRCGGCQLQHLAYDEQLRVKRGILLETLIRFSHLMPQDLRLLPAPEPFHYRSRVRFHVRRGVAGFFGPRQSEFVPVDRCLLAEEKLNDALALLPELLRRERTGEVELISVPKGVLVKMTGKRLYLWKGQGAGFKTVDRPVAFTQVNPAQNEVLRKEVADRVNEAAPSRVLELYAGSGNLTSAIAREGRKIVAVESDTAALELGRRVMDNLPGSTRFICMSADELHNYSAKWLNDMFGNPPAGTWESQGPSRHPADLVLLDPPRTGAWHSISGFDVAPPGRIVYVSCEPATLARDLNSLCRQSPSEPSYRLASLALIDMFPQTAHLETVATLEQINN